MNRKQLLSLLVMGIIYVTYVVVLFLVAKNLSKNFWLSFSFITASFLFMVLAYTFVAKPEIKAQVVGVPVTVLSTMYFVLEFVVGTVFMFLDWSFVTVFVPQFVLFALFLVIFLPAMLGNNYEKPAKEQPAKEQPVEQTAQEEKEN